MPTRHICLFRVLPGVVAAIALTAAGAAAQTALETSLFPKESRIAFVDLSQVAANSVPGKALLARLKAFRDGKLFELSEKKKQLDGMQARLDSGPAVLTETARTQLSKDVERMKREIQFGSDDAQAQLDDLEQEGFADLRKRLVPILNEIAAERRLDVIFSRTETAALFVDPRVDLSAEVTKRLDAAALKK